MTRIPRRHLVRIGDREACPETQFRVLHHAVKVPAIVIFIRRLVIVNVRVLILLFTAPPRWPVNEVRTRVQIHRRHADFCKIELIRAIKVASVGKLIRRHHTTLFACDHRSNLINRRLAQANKCDVVCIAPDVATIVVQIGCDFAGWKCRVFGIPLGTEQPLFFSTNQRYKNRTPWSLGQVLQCLGDGHHLGDAGCVVPCTVVNVVTGIIRLADAEVIVVSEYGILPVSRPVHVNRALRDAGLLVARATPDGDVLDPFGSAAFALADHQVAHVYCQDAAAQERAREVLENLPGVERVLGQDGKREVGLDHVNAGELVAVAESDAWFTYYYWTDDACEPDFARTVDIHRKPGYDPLELLIDPALSLPKLRVARRLVQKMLGFRYTMDVISLDATLIKGSHGRLPTPGKEAGEGPG
ncbi:MAG: alkaline phosphatase family protein, partial [Proteobacteria bacterium]|nr:alkaline phosphatase family protein [Pseudomonadota bacterium]